MTPDDQLAELRARLTALILARQQGHLTDDEFTTQEAILHSLIRIAKRAKAEADQPPNS